MKNKKTEINIVSRKNLHTCTVLKKNLNKNNVKKNDKT